MKKTVSYFLLFFIVTAVLFGSVGLSLGTMVCIKSGKAVVAFGKFQDCCKEEKEEKPGKDCCKRGNAPVHPEEDDCCDISSTEIKVDRYTGSKKAEPPVVKEIELPEPAKAEKQLTLFPSLLFAFDTSDTPPKPSGRSLLNIISRYTI